MQTLIIYASTHGTTEKVAQLMADCLGKETTTVINLKQQSVVDFSKYSKVIIGGSIHAGMVQKKIKDFCKEHTLELLQKPLGLFLCGMNEPEYENQLEKAFPSLLRDHAQACDTLGGEFIFEKMNFFQKLIVKKVSGISQSISKIQHQKIEEFASNMQQDSLMPERS